MKILYERADFYVCAERFGQKSGFAVYRNGVTAATRVASIGFEGERGLKRAIEEADRRALQK